MIHNLNNFVNESLGSSLASPANGLGGSRATSSLVAHFAKQNTKFGGVGKIWFRQRRTGSKRGRAKIPGGDGTPTPFLFARPSDWILKSRIRIFVKKCSNFVQKTPPIFAFCEIVRNSLGAKRRGFQLWFFEMWFLAVSVWKYPNGTGWARQAEFPPHPPSTRLALPARPKLLSEDGNRSGLDDFKFFFGGKF